MSTKDMFKYVGYAILLGVAIVIYVSAIVVAGALVSPR